MDSNRVATNKALAVLEYKIVRNIDMFLNMEVICTYYPLIEIVNFQIQNK